MDFMINEKEDITLNYGKHLLIDSIDCQLLH